MSGYRPEGGNGLSGSGGERWVRFVFDFPHIRGHILTLVGPFLYKNILKTVVYDCDGIKMNIVQIRFIIIYSFLFFMFIYF